MINFIPKVYAVDIESNFWLGEGAGHQTLSGKTLSSFIGPLIQDIFVLAGVILLILLIFGGVTFIMNAGSGDKEGMEKGKNALTMAILGFIIIFAAYWLVQIVQYITGIEIFTTKL